MIRIDLLLIRRPVRVCEMYLAERPRFPFLLLVIPIAGLLYFAFLYADHYIASGKEQSAANTMTVDERMQWSSFHEAIDDALQANTLAAR